MVRCQLWEHFLFYLISGLFLGGWILGCPNKFAVDLVSDPSLTLFLLWSIEFPVVAIVYSFLRKAPEKCSWSKAVGRSILGLISGAFMNALGAMLWVHLLDAVSLPLISCRYLPNNSLVLSNVCCSRSYQQLQFLVRRGQIGIVHSLDETNWKYRVYDCYSAYGAIVEDGLELGLCRSTGKAMAGVAYMCVLWSYRRLHCWTNPLLEFDVLFRNTQNLKVPRRDSLCPGSSERVFVFDLIVS
ncbi:hypothetical protein HID58_095017 [Brassica napus]|uniref:Uncharacterized protein n=1 Tax=Brassica napus TaxID=3708 RepID=A0ABQ7X527_BRANA|nr:hypothetical protein HID58_095017 [Brassica napus]